VFGSMPERNGIFEGKDLVLIDKIEIISGSLFAR
jgi:hypothetical protein